MAYYTWLTLLALTSLLPAIAGLFRFRKVDPLFFPFLLLLWLGAATEVGSLVLVYQQQSNLTVYNCFLLAEYWLLLWQFQRWGLFRGQTKMPLLLAGLGGLWWMAESFLLDNLSQVDSYFLIGASIVMVVFSIRTISNLLVFENYRLLHHGKFLICLGLLIYFAFSILMEAYLLFGLTLSQVFQVNISELSYYVNALVNVLFLYSVLCIPTRLQFMGRP